uniref:Uncharacterized protein n=1 Tax=Panagrolaimus superbus TaxID=310955 RepID=A0A914Y294_9BILA
MIKTVYIQNNEDGAKSTILHSNLFNSTIRSKVKIDCENQLSVSTGDNVLAYSYYCCPDFDNQYDITCNTPSLIPFHQNPDTTISTTAESNNNNNNHSSNPTPGNPNGSNSTPKSTNHHCSDNSNGSIVFPNIYLFLIVSLIFLATDKMI